jgi:hypothetical protein
VSPESATTAAWAGQLADALELFVDHESRPRDDQAG